MKVPVLQILMQTNRGCLPDEGITFAVPEFDHGEGERLTVNGLLGGYLNQMPS